MRAALLIALFLLPLAPAHDMGVGYDLAAEMGLFPTPDEVQAVLREADKSDHIQTVVLGESGEGKPITLARVLYPGLPVEERVRVLLLTQQHGNEPAGTPAALQLIEEIVANQDTSRFGELDLLIVPQVNPDGSGANTRGNAAGVDVNRDHVAVETPESIVIHALLRDFNIHVAVDHHEYSGQGIGFPFPVRTYDWDYTTMFPNHGNVHPEIRALSEELVYEAVWPHLNEKGYSTGDYGVVTVQGVPIQQVAGGPDPGILRNSFGLNNVVGFLGESFVPLAIENPFVTAERRQAVHYESMRATIDFAIDERETLMAAKAAAGRDYRSDLLSNYQEAEAAGSVPEAFLASSNVDELMAKHGLPTGMVVESGVLYETRNDRQGLVLAILHPDSSRQVVSTSAASTAEPGLVGEEKEAPGISGILVLSGILALAFVGRRRD